MDVPEKNARGYVRPTGELNYRRLAPGGRPSPLTLALPPAVWLPSRGLTREMKAQAFSRMTSSSAQLGFQAHSDGTETRGCVGFWREALTVGGALGSH